MKSGFSAGLMTGLLNAGSALSTAQAHSRSISHLESRAATLESEIKSGYGDVDGKQQELEQVQEQTVKAHEMQQSALSQATTGLQDAVGSEKEDATSAAYKNENAVGIENKVSDQSEKEAARLQSSHPDTNIAAVDYDRNAYIEQKGKTSIAMSPKLLESIAQDSVKEADWNTNLLSMRDIDFKYAQAETGTASVVWAAGADGRITRHVTVASAQEAADRAGLNEQIAQDAHAAFGSAFGGVQTHVAGSQPAAGPYFAGLLVDQRI